MIQILRHGAEGFARLYENENWTVALKNAGPSNCREAVVTLERHNQTDELFLLLSGNAVMMEGTVENETVTGITEKKMESGCIYLIPHGVWHNTWMEPGAKFVIIENADTSYDNTDVIGIGPECRKEI